MTSPCPQESHIYGLYVQMLAQAKGYSEQQLTKKLRYDASEQEPAETVTPVLCLLWEPSLFFAGPLLCLW